ncbi:MAG: hypothetical protein AAFP77_22495 [Bacteroidota bacterium]
MYRILPEGYASYALRNSLRVFAIILVVFIGLMVFLSLSTGGAVLRVLASNGPLMPLFLIALILGIRMMQERNLAAATCFVLTEDSVSKLMNYDQLNIGNRRAVSKGERYGGKMNQTIALSNISKIDFKSSGIRITSRDYSFLTGNGRIFIPKETEKFAEITRFFQQVKGARL